MAEFLLNNINTPRYSSAAISEKFDAQRQKSCRNVTFVMRKFSISLLREKTHNYENLQKYVLKRCL